MHPLLASATRNSATVSSNIFEHLSDLDVRSLPLSPVLNFKVETRRYSTSTIEKFSPEIEIKEETKKRRRKRKLNWIKERGIFVRNEDTESYRKYSFVAQNHTGRASHSSSLCLCNYDIYICNNSFYSASIGHLVHRARNLIDHSRQPDRRNKRARFESRCNRRSNTAISIPFAYRLQSSRINLLQIARHRAVFLQTYLRTVHYTFLIPGARHRVKLVSSAKVSTFNPSFLRRS